MVGERRILRGYSGGVKVKAAVNSDKSGDLSQPGSEGHGSGPTDGLLRQNEIPGSMFPAGMIPARRRSDVAHGAGRLLEF